jgi:hypothetical protein
MMSGLQMKYFVLKPKGDDIYSVASRKAMRAYALAVSLDNPELCDELRNWADDEMLKSKHGDSDRNVEDATS